MPVRTFALSAMFLLALGTAPLTAFTDDQFGEWANSRATSGGAKSTKRDSRVNVTYFSPKTSEAAPEPAGALPPSEQPVAPASSTDTSPAMPSPEMPSAKIPMRERVTVSPVSADEILFTAKPSAARTESVTEGTPSPVRTASFTQESGMPQQGTIRQVSDKSPSKQSIDETRNPFAEFLEEQSSAGKPASVSGNQFDESPAPGVKMDRAETIMRARREAALRARASDTGFNPENEPAILKQSVSPKTTAAKPVSLARPAAFPSEFEASRPGTAESGPQSPGITVQWVRRGSFNVGQECNVDLVLENTSKSVIRGIVTEAQIPENVDLLSARPAPAPDAAVPSWRFGEMKPGEKHTISLVLVPQDRGDVQLDAVVRLTSFASTNISVQEPMIGVVLSGPEQVEVGEQLGYVVRVSNPGTGTATNVVIQAAVPEGLEHRSGSILSIEVGTLNPGESRQARLSLTAVKGGPQKLAVRAIAEGNLSDEAAAEVRVAEPQLQIAIRGPEEQTAGRTGDYMMTVTNSGNVQSANVRAKYRIPRGFEFVSADRGGKYSKADHSVEWFVGTVQPNEESDFMLTLRANTQGELLHQAGVMSEHGQVKMCSYATTVEGMAALDLSITSSRPETRRGDELTWSVKIRNSGSRVATGVGMSCELPNGIELIDATGPSDHIAENGVMVFRSIPVIEPGEEVVYEITGHCLREGNHRLRLRVASESISEPLIGEELMTVTR